MDLHHPILREFPEHRDTIKRLKAANDQFRKEFEDHLEGKPCPYESVAEMATA